MPKPKPKNMKLKGVQFSILQVLCLALYYGLAQFLPGRRFGRWCRYRLCRHIFQYCGQDVNIERRAHFGSGRQLRIGDHSGLGIRCDIPSNTIIGCNVMMGPDVCILPHNHHFDRTDIPMIKQGIEAPRITTIEDDVWIGRNVMMTPGRTIRQGSIIGAGCVLTKDFEPYSIVGGNPSRLIRNRKEEVKS